MSLYRVGRRGLRPFAAKCARRAVTMAPAEAPEYVSEPQYPKILDLSYLAKKQRERNLWHNQVQEVKTVEEKIIKVNMPKFYGWISIMMNNAPPLQSLPLIQHVTRTSLVCGLENLAEKYIAHDSAATYHAEQMKEQIEEALLFEFQAIRRKIKYTNLNERSARRQDNRSISQSVMKQINRIILNNLSSNVPHLMESQVDIEPRHEAFWFAGGMDPPVHTRKIKEKTVKEFAHNPVDRAIQYIGDPVLTLRSNLPLEPFAPYDDVDDVSQEVPFYKFDPRTVGYFAERRHGINIPGFWPGDTHEFGLLSYLARDHFLDHPFTRYGEEEKSEILHSQGLLASFGWLHAQAFYQGFTMFNDITYPLTTQTIISDGQHWSFYAYQMNTLLLNHDNINTNKKRNICLCTEPLKLFEGIDDNGKIVGFNKDVLKMLIQFYLNTPKEREGVNMKPYLGDDIKFIADIEEDERRVWLENRYKHLVANRPTYVVPYETYWWERIYKIKFQTRFTEPKRRPFELGINPYNRRLDEHLPEYIPRCLRVGGYFDKRKWRKTYYP